MKKKTILVVEDNSLLVALITENLRTAGFNVIVARDGKQGLEMLFSGKPDLIWLDMHLPVMSGSQLLEQLNQDENMKKIPVIVVTVSSSKHELLAQKFNIVGCFIKSETPIADIVSKISGLLNR